MYPSQEYPYRGTFVKNSVNGIAEHGIEMKYCVIVRERKNKLLKTLEYLRFIFRSIFYLLLKNDFDFIYLHYLNHTLIPIVICGRLINKPIVMNAHGGDIFPSGMLGSLMSKFTHPVIKKAQLLVVPSKYFEKIMIDDFQIIKNKVFVSPSGGIDLEVFKSNLVKPDNDQLKIIFIGRIEEDKRWMDFIEMCTELKNLNINYCARIIGSGSQSKQLKSSIKGYGLINFIEYLPGLPQEEISRSLSEFDLFIFPSFRKSESLGLVGLEAMACGLPVVGAKSGGILTYVNHGVNGLLFDPANVSQIVKCITTYMAMSEEEVLEMRRNAVKTSLLYDRNRVCKNLAIKIRNVINE